MTWTKLSDDFSDDCWTLSDAAFRLHTEALVWNGRKLLDCRLPKDDVRRFAKHPEVVDELLSCGWWTEAGDVYMIRHHAQYQRLREAVVAQQEANVKNGAKGGRPRNPREQASAVTSKPSETQSGSEPLSGSGTERDRTGQNRTGTAPKEGNHAHAHAHTRTGPPCCSVCGGRLDGPLSIAEGICAWCDTAAVAEKSRSVA